MSEWTLDDLAAALDEARAKRKALDQELRAAERRHAAELEQLQAQRAEARAEEVLLDRERQKLVYGS